MLADTIKFILDILLQSWLMFIMSSVCLLVASYLYLVNSNTVEAIGVVIVSVILVIAQVIRILMFYKM